MKKKELSRIKKKVDALPGHRNVSIQALQSIRKCNLCINLRCERIRATGPTVQISVLRVAWKIEI